MRTHASATVRAGFGPAPARSRSRYLDERERGFEIYQRALILADDTVRSQDGRRLAAFTLGDPCAPTIL